VSSQVIIFARFHAKAGRETALALALQETVAATHQEKGCLSIEAFRCIRDPKVFYIHSRWFDELAFNLHVDMPHTVHFVDRAQALIDHPLEVTRTRPLA
jgi:quinol monooxygenase YgiN